MIDRSDKIRIISYLASWGVVVWHCYCGSSIERWFIPIFSYWAVPWFFLISGYFLLSSFDRRNMAGFYMSKCTSLLLPYLMWCLIGYLIYAIFSGWIIPFSIPDVFALRSPSPKFNRPLWYARALIVFMVIAGAILTMLRAMRIKDGLLRVFLLSMFFFVVVYFINQRIFQIYGPGSSLIYFLMGVWLRWAGNVSLFERWNKTVVRWSMLVLCMVAFLTFRVIWFRAGHSFSSTGAGGTLLNNVSSCLMIVSLWLALDLVKLGAMREKVISVCGTSAFVYFFHRPLLTCLIKYFQKYFVSLDGLFILMVVLYAPFCSAFAFAVKRFCPKSYSILVGGR